jgi:hypothetical protein
VPGSPGDVGAGRQIPHGPGDQELLAAWLDERPGPWLHTGVNGEAPCRQESSSQGDSTSPEAGRDLGGLRSAPPPAAISACPCWLLSLAAHCFLVADLIWPQQRPPLWGDARSPNAGSIMPADQRFRKGTRVPAGEGEESSHDRASVRGCSDFEDADRGFIAKLDPGVVTSRDGRVVWDIDSYGFLSGDCPDTANPSLWRQQQLCARQGLYEVTDGVY